MILTKLFAYVVITVVVYAVLAKLAQKSGNSHLSPYCLTAAALWPVWGELGVLLLVGYIVYKVLLQQRHT